MLRGLALFLLFASSALSLSLERPVRYDGHVVFQCPNSDGLAEHVDSMLLDVWAETAGFIDVMVSPGLQAGFAQRFNCSIVNPDVQMQIDLETARLRTLESAQKARRDVAEWFGEYHSFEDLYLWYKELGQSEPNVDFLPEIGTTFQGRPIAALHITDFQEKGPKTRIYFQGLQHAREWISGATVNYLVNELLQDKQLLAEFEFYVVPIVNPDGYEYTWTTNRLWRKNRRTNSGSNCVGVDLNRNWRDHWGQGGSSTNPCSDTFMGPSVASEAEVQALQDFIASVEPDAAIDYHAYSQLILRPYGWTNQAPPDDKKFTELGAAMASAIAGVYGKGYKSIPSIDLYATTGGASDWFYGTDIEERIGHPTWSFTIELRPAGANPGFQLPPSEILPTAEENYAAFLTWVKFAAANPWNSNDPDLLVA